MLTKARQTCLAIRNRRYPESQWPAVRYRRAVADFGSPTGVLLEVGCGRTGPDLRELSEHYGRSIGIDMEIEPAACKAGRVSLLCGDAHRIPLADASVDVAACADVAEHLADPAAFFAECRRVLRPCGRLVILTVNRWFPPIAAARLLPHRLRQALNRIASGTAERDTFPTHYRANTGRRLRDLADSAGLMTDSVEYVSHHPVYFLFSTTAYRAAVFCEQLVRRHERLAPLRHLILATFRRPGMADDSRASWCVRRNRFASPTAEAVGHPLAVAESP